MATKAPTKDLPKQTNSGFSQVYVTTRILLALWEMDAEEKPVSKGKLAKDYQPFLSQLEKDGAIALAKQKRTTTVTLLAKGVELLGQGLRNPEFEFPSQIGAKTANALLQWMREMQGTATPVASNGKVAASEIASYEAFKPVALEVYDRLNRDYNMGNLVPIYRIRREIGDQVSRSNFNEWLFEMQSEDIFQLLEESVEDSAPDKIEDSITTKLGKLRCYAKRLAA
jgi:hypothetical protein